MLNMMLKPYPYLFSILKYFETRKDHDEAYKKL